MVSLGDSDAMMPNPAFSRKSKFEGAPSIGRIEAWTNDQVVEWAASHGLDTTSWKKNLIEGRDLVEMTEEDMRDELLLGLDEAQAKEAYGLVKELVEEGKKKAGDAEGIDIELKDEEASSDAAKAASASDGAKGGEEGGRRRFLGIF